MESPNPRRAVTLVELVVVVLILGVMAGIAAPLALQSQNDSSTAATLQHLETIALALEMYRNEEGRWPDDGAAGAMPPGMVGYLRPNLFAVPCPAGGTYDWDQGVDGVTARLRVTGPSSDRSVWQAVDRELDDGDLATGSLRAASGTPAINWVLED